VVIGARTTSRVIAGLLTARGPLDHEHRVEVRGAYHNMHAGPEKTAPPSCQIQPGSMLCWTYRPVPTPCTGRWPPRSLPKGAPANRVHPTCPPTPTRPTTRRSVPRQTSCAPNTIRALENSLAAVFRPRAMQGGGPTGGADASALAGSGGGARKVGPQATTAQSSAALSIERDHPSGGCASPEEDVGTRPPGRTDDEEHHVGEPALDGIGAGVPGRRGGR
jgi:hypothetical protein